MINKREVSDITLTGSILKGRYCIVEPIGEGGQGHLYLARDLELGVYWAVKQIPITQKKEARLLRILRHPAMPGMIDYLEKDDFCYLVMEYIRGENLGQYMRRGGRFSVEEVIRMGISTADVLQYLHGRVPAVIHGDVKPENLMLDENGHLYLVDFGSAAIRYGKNARSVTGTKGYAAPEQYDGKSSECSDVYAFGQTFLSILRNCRKKELLRYPALPWIFLRCARKNPERRMQSMKEAKAALKKIQNHAVNVIHVIQILMTVFLLAAAVLVAAVGKEKPEKNFYEALNEVTAGYYRKEFLEAEEGKRKEFLLAAEEELQKLQEIYSEEEEQRKLLLLLAVNCELARENGRAQLYYEQLLLYHPDYRAGYGAYGMYLKRSGQQETEEDLREEYKKQEKLGKLDGTDSPELRKWEETFDVDG